MANIVQIIEIVSPRIIVVPDILKFLSVQKTRIGTLPPIGLGESH